MAAIAVLLPLAAGVHDVLRNQAPLHGVTENAAEVDEHAPDHRR